MSWKGLRAEGEGSYQNLKLQGKKNKDWLPLGARGTVLAGGI